MSQYVFTIVVLCAGLIISLEAAQVEVVTRQRAHSSRTISSVTQNFDLGFMTQEDQEVYEKQKTAQQKLRESFFKAAQTGEGLEPFFAMSDFNFNIKNELDGGKTALMYIAKLGRVDLAAKLMEKKAWAFTVKDHEGLCAYDYAEGHGDVRKIMQTAQFHDLCRRNSIKKTMTDVCTVLYQGVTIIGPKDEDDEKE